MSYFVVLLPGYDELTCVGVSVQEPYLYDLKAPFGETFIFGGVGSLVSAPIAVDMLDDQPLAPAGKGRSSMIDIGYLRVPRSSRQM